MKVEEIKQAASSKVASQLGTKNELESTLDEQTALSSWPPQCAAPSTGRSLWQSPASMSVSP